MQRGQLRFPFPAADAATEPTAAKPATITANASIVANAEPAAIAAASFTAAAITAATLPATVGSAPALAPALTAALPTTSLVGTRCPLCHHRRLNLRREPPIWQLRHARDVGLCTLLRRLLLSD